MSDQSPRPRQSIQSEPDNTASGLSGLIQPQRLLDVLQNDLFNLARAGFSYASKALDGEVLVIVIKPPEGAGPITICQQCSNPLLALNDHEC